MAKRGYFSAERFTPRALPQGYTQVEYIESNGTQYIDTGFIPNQDTRVVVDFQMVAENTLAANDIFGARTSASSKAFAVQWNTANNQFQHFYNNGYTNLNFGDFDIRQVLEMNKNVFTLNGVTNTRTYASFQCAYALYLFALNNAGTVAFYSKMRMYSCQIYDNSTLVRDFVPCYRDSDHAVGLYDMVNGVFYANAGTGMFICPEPPLELPQGYTQVAYIEATGTQYINTGFVANQDTSVTIDFEVTDTTATSWLFCGRKSSSADAYGVYAYKGGSNFYFMYGTERNNFAGDPTKRQICKVIKNQCSIGDTTVTVAEQTFSSSVPLCLLVRNTNGTIEAFATARVYSCQIYDNGTLIRDYIPCINPNGTAGLYDKVNGVFYGNAGTGSFLVGDEVHSDVAREPKKIYFSDNGVALEAKKAYYGDENGIARRWYGNVDIGESVFMNVNGVRTEFIVVHIGKPDTDLYGESCNGVWLLMKDVYPEEMVYAYSSEETYGSTAIHWYLKNTFFNLLDSDIKSTVKQAMIPTSSTGSMCAYVFLPSAYELGKEEETNDDYEVYPARDGTVLDYFIGDASKRKCYNNGNLTKYPTRTMGMYYDDEEGEDVSEYLYVHTNGNIYYNSSEYEPMEFPRPMMIFPYPLQVDGWNNVIGHTPTNIGELPVGSSLFMNEGGTRVEFIIIHQGLPDANLYDSSCNGTWVLRKECYAEGRFSALSSINTYSASNLDDSMTNYFNRLDTVAQDAIIEATIPCLNLAEAVEIENLTRKVFALSYSEVGCISQDGVALQYFDGVGSYARKTPDTDSGWWSRTGNTFSIKRAYYFSSSGVATSSKPTEIRGVRPAMILNPSMRFDENFNVIG